MIRPLAVAAALAVASLAGAASAQTWGQPIYVSPYGRVVGGTPLSEIETRAYVNTGRWADGYSDQAYVYVPAPVYGERYGYGYGRDYGHDRRRPERGYGYGDRYAYGHGRRAYGYGHGGYEPRPRPGYRDVWGYNDDRHPSSRRWSSDRRARRYDRDCGCGDVYLYDR
ncbi:hypothetical protein [Brevundimonas sp.]|uniref:hypothetical protein n=1 Tax=Brevundimonas sp. TaxID=1871086 RepID=UPI002D34C2F8|nr:hypothetical protein [Brevundimonas sp.]HYC68462.1 hypothetical protein [Brevundimonas sp.]